MRPSARVVVLFAATAVAVLMGGSYLYFSQERHWRADARDALAAVSRLKVDQISRWRESRISDAALWSEDPYLSGPVVSYLSAPSPAALTALRSSLLVWKTEKAWSDIAVADPGGNLVLSVNGATGPLYPDEAAALRQAFISHKPVLTDLHRGPHLPPHLSAVAPLFAASKGGNAPAGAVILHCDAANILYPLILSWPTASRTAETALWRRDGNDMMVLNQLRHSPLSAFEMRVSLARREVPIVMAANGATGFVRGLDYRGVPVFADVRAVPGTSWFTVTKIDVSEAMAPWRAGALQLACLLAGLLTALGAFFFALWQVRTRAHAQLLLAAETARSTTAGRLAAIVDGSQDSIISTTADGTVTAWNPAAEHLFGYTTAEMIGQTVSRCIPPELRAGEDATMAIVLGGGWMKPYETVRLTSDGRLVDISLCVSPIRDASGSVVGMSRIVRDITAEKSTRRDLERLRWMLSPSAEVPPADPLPTAAACRFAAVNTRHLIFDAAGESLLSEIAGGFHSLMGTCFTVHEANGDLAYNLLASDWCRFLDSSTKRHCDLDGGCEPKACNRWMCHGLSARNAALETMARGEPIDILRVDGVRLYSVPIRACGEVVGSMSVGYGDPPRDPAQLTKLAAMCEVTKAELERHAANYETRPLFIVELAKQRLAGSARLLGEIVQRSRAEALLRHTTEDLTRSNRELEHFAHVASHDLQEPLRMVASYTQLLAQRYHDQLDQDARDFIGYAVDGATRMKQLIEDLLAYSRVTARGQQVAVVDSQNAFSLALHNLEIAIAESHAEVSCGELPGVQADEGQLIQLFQNLVANAIKFRTPGVLPRVRVEACRSPDLAGRWIFRVADNGIGIDPKFFDRVFVIFQRLHSRHEYPGTGIGLALCQRIVERHGGRIWIESAPGQGTAFLFTLPEADPGKGVL